MADVVNLRQARKAKARKAKTDAGAEARAKHGEKKTAKTARTLETARADRTLDASRREPDESDGV